MSPTSDVVMPSHPSTGPVLQPASRSHPLLLQNIDKRTALSFSTDHRGSHAFAITRASFDTALISVASEKSMNEASFGNNPVGRRVMIVSILAAVPGDATSSTMVLWSSLADQRPRWITHLHAGGGWLQKTSDNRAEPRSRVCRLSLLLSSLVR